MNRLTEFRRKACLKLKSFFTCTSIEQYPIHKISTSEARELVEIFTGDPDRYASDKNGPTPSLHPRKEADLPCVGGVTTAISQRDSSAHTIYALPASEPIFLNADAESRASDLTQSTNWRPNMRFADQMRYRAQYQPTRNTQVLLTELDLGMTKAERRRVETTLVTHHVRSIHTSIGAIAMPKEDHDFEAARKLRPDHRPWLSRDIGVTSSRTMNHSEFFKQTGVAGKHTLVTRVVPRGGATGGTWGFAYLHMVKPRRSLSNTFVKSRRQNDWILTSPNGVFVWTSPETDAGEAFRSMIQIMRERDLPTFMWKGNVTNYPQPPIVTYLSNGHRLTVY